MFNYRAVGNRLAVDLDYLYLPMAKKEAIGILKQKGFRETRVDIVESARDCMGKSKYRLGARLSEAPEFFDCSGFVKWVYGQCGIWLPRRSIQQRAEGIPIELNEVKAGDLLFFSGLRRNYYYDNPKEGVGHVSLATSDKTIIHFVASEGLCEMSIASFACKRKFQGARRYIPQDRKLLTLEVPRGREVETSDDIQWIILQTLE